MGKNVNFVSHKKSKLKENGGPKLPLASDLVEGEIAINFGKDVETLSIKNESGDVVTFSSDNYYTEKKLGSGFTGANSAVTVTEALENVEIDVDQVLDDTTSASTNPVSSKAVYDAVTENELVWANAFVVLSGTVSAHTANTEIHVTAADKEKLHTHSNKASLDSITGNVGTMAYEDKVSYSSATDVNTALGNKANTSDLAAYADSVKYNSTTHYVEFYHGTTAGTKVFEYDASPFIIDGMVQNVEIKDVTSGGSQVTCLVISFNTDAGKQDINIPLTDIFDASNYYNKAAIDSLVGSGFSSSSITEVIIENEKIVSAALNNLDEKKLDASAYTPSVELWVSGTGLNSVVLKGSSGTASGDYSVVEGTGTTASGNQSHAEGSNTTASGLWSHAEGDRAIASGQSSHAEGQQTVAGGRISHAEGYLAKANGRYSHAEGESTTATNQDSHAEGYYTTASGYASHAEGYKTVAGGSSSHAEGNNTTASSYASHAEGNETTASGQSSHAEGYLSRAYGDYSHAEGRNTEASGLRSHAEGSDTKAIGNYSHAEGSSTTASGMLSHAEGNATSASSFSSHAEGNGTTASGNSSHAEGETTRANGSYSHAEGNRTITNNQSEHASGQYNVSNSASTTFGDSGNTLFSVGNGTADNAKHNAFEIRQNGDIYITSGSSDIKLQDYIGGTSVELWESGTGLNSVVLKGSSGTASGDYSVAEGYQSSASGQSSHAEGDGTTASGNYSHAEGYKTSATTWEAHSEGDSTSASGAASHAEGSYTKAIGHHSHTEGESTSATSQNAHAEGGSTTASGENSHAEGERTIASNYRSHAEGYKTIASGIDSHAEGQSTSATSFASHVEGYYTETKNSYEHASGQYNISSSGSSTFGDSGNTLFSVGNGTADDARHNAFEIRQNGDIYIVSGSSDIKLQDYIGSVETVTAITPSNSGSTDPIATKVVAENELTVSNALNDLDIRKLNISNFNTYSGGVDTAINSKASQSDLTALSGTVTGHTSNTNIHLTTTEKTNVGALATNIGTISGITSAKVSGWDAAATNSHSHTNKTALDSITGNVGTMAYQATTSYSSATQVNTALGRKVNTATFTAHTADTNVHFTTNDRLKWETLNRRTRKNFTASGMTYFTNTLKSAIAGQDLEKYGLKVGDYCSATHDGNTYNYIIAGLNTMKGTHSYRLTTGHVGIIVDTNDTHKWNKSDNTYQSTNRYSTGGTWTTGASAAGYANCDLHYYLTTTVLPYVEADLGSSNIKSHYKLYSTAVNRSGYNRFGSASGCSSSWAWYANQKICALSEIQVYGSIVWSSSGYDTGEACRQLDVFRVYNMNEIFEGRYPWLRDVASASHACNANHNGHAYYTTASNAMSVAALILFA